MDIRSQKKKILDYMEMGYKINPKIALKKFGCMRLSARIADIKKEGFLIGREMVYLDDGSKYAEYWLVETR